MDEGQVDQVQTVQARRDEARIGEVQVGSEILYCGECARWQPFERPPCQDGHGAECPERICVACGYAVLVGVIPEARRPGSRPMSVAAPAVAAAGRAGGRVAARVMA